MAYLNGVEEKIGYEFKNKDLLITALTHRSYSHDNKDDEVGRYNERLEFLGDAVLENVISVYLYNIEPLLKEGEMSKKRAEIVCEMSLSKIVRGLELQQYLKLGKCEINTGGRKKDALLADMFEAILGAIYIDSNFETVRDVCMNLLSNRIEEVLNKQENFDYKTSLQEILQKDGNVQIKYIMVKCTGMEHDKTFYTELYFNNKKIGEGSGKTKKESEQQAAKKAIQNIKVENKSKE